MKKITSLTPEQTAQMAVYRDKWIAIGLSTDPADRPRAERGIHLAYKAAKLSPPATIIWCDSPMAITQAVTKANGGKKSDILGGYCYGQHDASWLAFYDYFKDVCGLVKETAPLEGLWEIAQSAGWWYPCTDTCWISERPRVLHRDAAGQLHADGRMALEYPDGWGVYALHGVRVPKELVLTPPEKLKVSEWVVKQTNAEIRREAVRKIGIERVCRDLKAKVLETGTDHAGQPCDLLALDLGDGRVRPYIKLRHPGVGTYHIEGVSPECRTLEQAFAFRNGTQEEPEWLR